MSISSFLNSVLCYLLFNTRRGSKVIKNVSCFFNLKDVDILENSKKFQEATLFNFRFQFSSHIPFYSKEVIQKARVHNLNLFIIILFVII